MRRKINDKEKYPEIYSIVGVLPFVCDKCIEVIWLEKGYYAYVGPYYGGIGHKEEVCRKCCPTRKEAHEFFFNKEFRKHPDIPQ